MKRYSLFLHYKQGDDFSHHLEASKSLPEALQAWADSFKENEAVCRQLAQALNKVSSEDVEVQADTHMIAFTPMTAKGTEVLELLTKEKLVSCEDLEDDEYSEEDEGSEDEGAVRS